MDLATAVGHALGALSATAVLHAAFFVFSQKVAKRRTTEELESIGAQLGIPAGELTDPRHAQSMQQEALRRCSKELFRNRASDALGAMLRVLAWLVSASMIAIPLMAGVICWYDRTLDLTMLWAMPIIYAAYVMLASLVSFICLIMTGRTPGQAKMTRQTFGYTS